jgi:hypothetical protein
VYGPIPVDWLDNFAVFIKNCSTVNLNLRIRTSIDQARNIEDDLPLGSFTNTQAMAAKPGETVVRTLYGDANPFKYISIVGSATATINPSQTVMVITGRAMK